ncbi:hypothetical protein N431DRAFT_514313 [Stipitochalara longipes BDJ]|nr:hypothetical protein N431DRAFT_514313 [Stipitochalara longipes BDJ]
MSTPEDEIERTVKERSSHRRKINFRLKMSPVDQMMIRIMNEDREATEDLEDMGQESDEGSPNTELEKTTSLPGKFKEESDSDDEKGSLALKQEFDGDFDSTQAVANNDKSKGESDRLLDVKKESEEHFDSTQVVLNNEASGEADSAQTVLNNVEYIERVDNYHQHSASSCTRASALSPYCQVMVKPSWETSALYRYYKQEPGPWLHLVLAETSYKVPKELILSKIPCLPSIYFDLTDEEEDEHKLDESLHNVNLMLYWVKRAEEVDGMTWDAYELIKFARRLLAKELVDCIHRIVVLR